MMIPHHDDIPIAQIAPRLAAANAVADPLDLDCETATGSEFCERAQALAHTLAAAEPNWGQVARALHEYCAYLLQFRDRSPGPGAAAEINAVLWHAFSVEAQSGEQAGLRQLVIDISALAVKDFRLTPNRRTGERPELPYYHAWDEQQTRLRGDYAPHDVLRDPGCQVLIDGLHDMGDAEQVVKGELLEYMARLSQYLGYTVQNAIAALRADFGPGQSKREQGLHASHYLHLQLLALADDPRSEVARLDAIEPAPGRKGRTSVKRVLPAPPPEDPASIWGALRHWAANDPFCAYLFYTRWRWLARHDYQRFSAADHAAARLIA